MDESDEEEEEVSDPTVTTEFQKEIQEATDTQVLSPRGRKIQRHSSKQPTSSTPANSGRPNTRSKSRGL